MARRSAFRRAVTLVVMAPLTLLLVVFAVSNREAVMLSLWPLSEGVAAPLYLLVLGLFVLGAVIGGLTVWLSGAGTRRALRQAAYAAESEARTLRSEVERLERARSAAADPSRSLTISG
jgi:uncharacterized integral membrane protein